MDRVKMDRAIEECRNALEKIYREGYEAGHRDYLNEMSESGRDCLNEMSESGRDCAQCVFCEVHKDQSGHCYMWGSHLYRVDDDGCAMFLRNMKIAGLQRRKKQ